MHSPAGKLKHGSSNLILMHVTEINRPAHKLFLTHCAHALLACQMDKR